MEKIIPMFANESRDQLPLLITEFFEYIVENIWYTCDSKFCCFCGINGKIKGDEGEKSYTSVTFDSIDTFVNFVKSAEIQFYSPIDALGLSKSVEFKSLLEWYLGDKSTVSSLSEGFSFGDRTPPDDRIFRLVLEFLSQYDQLGPEERNARLDEIFELRKRYSVRR